MLKKDNAMGLKILMRFNISIFLFQELKAMGERFERDSDGKIY